jgi:hypothetical protein
MVSMAVLEHYEVGLMENDFPLTLRDYFASAAMQGMLANSELKGTSAFDIADWAYYQADAMIEARNEKSKHE